MDLSAFAKDPSFLLRRSLAARLSHTLLPAYPRDPGFRRDDDNMRICRTQKTPTFAGMTIT